jgi:anti-sigma factor RsiW
MEQLLSRGLDGEINQAERAELDRLLETDPELRKLETAWRAYADVLRAQPAPPPPTPEAAWADVQRAIRIDRGAAPRRNEGVFGWRLGWASATIAIALVGFGGWSLRYRPASPTAMDVGRDVEVEFVESDLPGAQPMVYEDAETGITVVWIAGLDNGAAISKDT